MALPLSAAVVAMAVALRQVPAPEPMALDARGAQNEALSPRRIKRGVVVSVKVAGAHQLCLLVSGHHELVRYIYHQPWLY